MIKKIVHFSDTHKRHDTVKLPDCDICIFTGDATARGGVNDTIEFLRWYKKQYQCTHKVFIPGNHDLGFDFKFNLETGAEFWMPDIVKEFFDEADYRNIIYIQNEMKVVDDIQIWGSPVTPDFHPQYWAFNKPRGDEIMKVWEHIPMAPHIVATHGPVHGIGDFVTGSGGHQGCEDLKAAIETIRPLIHLCGHIHEGYGVVEKDGIWYSNGSICDDRYRPNNLPIEFSIDTEKNEIIYGT